MFYSKQLKKYNKIKHCFFSRNRGFSKGLYKSLNCGKGSNDNKKNILKNLLLISKKMDVKKSNLALMYQTHSKKVIEIKKNYLKKRIYSDAIITKTKNLALCVVTADCVPILLYDYINNIIGCIHAGWKGAYSGIIENTIIKMNKINNNNKIIACIGPCIGKNSYEVDINFYKKFQAQTKKNKKYFFKKNKSKLLFDLRGYVSDKLVKYNIKVDHVNRDTFKDKRNFFSYRRATLLKQKDYGRCISVIKLV